MNESPDVKRRLVVSVFGSQLFGSCKSSRLLETRCIGDRVVYED